MKWTVPGTVIQIEMQETELFPQQLASMFLAGGIQLNQVCSITALEPHAVQNWVKRGFLSPPKNKHYDLEQLCRIITINMLRPALSLEQICGLLQHINGDLKREDDDLIDDSTLYFLFLRLAAHHRQMHTSPDTELWIEEILDSYAEPIPGAKDRVKEVLRIMLTAWAASQLRLAAEQMVSQLF